MITYQPVKYTVGSVQLLIWQQALFAPFLLRVSQVTIIVLPECCQSVSGFFVSRMMATWHLSVMQPVRPSLALSDFSSYPLGQFALFFAPSGRAWQSIPQFAGEQKKCPWTTPP